MLTARSPPRRPSGLGIAWSPWTRGGQMRRPHIRRLVVVSVAGLLLALLHASAALAQPANDDFDSATVIAALPFSDSISTADATTAGDDPSCTGNEHTVWYAFTPTQDGIIMADTVGS